MGGSHSETEIATIEASGAKVFRPKEDSLLRRKSSGQLKAKAMIAAAISRYLPLPLSVSPVPEFTSFSYFSPPSPVFAFMNETKVLALVVFGECSP